MKRKKDMLIFGRTEEQFSKDVSKFQPAQKDDCGFQEAGGGEMTPELIEWMREQQQLKLGKSPKLEPYFQNQQPLTKND